MPSKEIECVTVLLAVSDDEERGRLERILRHSSWSVHPVATLREATAVLQEGTTGVVVCGLRFPHEGSWESLVRESQHLIPAPRVIITDRLSDEVLWTAVLGGGCYDALRQPFDSQEVFEVLSSAYRFWREELRSMTARGHQADICAARAS